MRPAIQIITVMPRSLALPNEVRITYARFSHSTADDRDQGPRRDRKLGNPSDDLSILCWDLEALPTHHLPWAGFGLRQPHWLIQKCDVENSRIHCDLEKNQTTGIGRALARDY